MESLDETVYTILDSTMTCSSIVSPLLVMAELVCEVSQKESDLQISVGEATIDFGTATSKSNRRLVPRTKAPPASSAIMRWHGDIWHEMNINRLPDYVVICKPTRKCDVDAGYPLWHAIVILDRKRSSHRSTFRTGVSHCVPVRIVVLFFKFSNAWLRAFSVTYHRRRHHFFDHADHCSIPYRLCFGARFKCLGTSGRFGRFALAFLTEVIDTHPEIGAFSLAVSECRPHNVLANDLMIQPIPENHLVAVSTVGLPPIERFLKLEVSWKAIAWQLSRLAIGFPPTNHPGRRNPATCRNDLHLHTISLLRSDGFRSRRIPSIPLASLALAIRCQ